MKIHERIKSIREEKKLSQEAIAYSIGLSQSQYSRRESGESRFTADEIMALSKALDTHISELYGIQPMTFNNTNHQGGIAIVGEYYNVPDKLIEQYEKRLQEKDELITLLKEQLERQDPL
jgi:transcriptional regulator with XRE-family HTH domain